MRLLMTLCFSTITSTTISTDKRSRFRLFNLLLLLCAANVLLYTYFSRTNKTAWPSFHAGKYPHVDTPLTAANDTRIALSAGRDFNLENRSSRSSFPTTSNVFWKPDSVWISQEDIIDVSSDTISSSHSVLPDVSPSLLKNSDSHKTSDMPSADAELDFVVTFNDSSVQSSENLNSVGPFPSFMQETSWFDIAKVNPGLEPGGRYKPPHCQARHRVAIVIPYRNRERHLKLLLSNLHPMLARQQLDYGIFVIDQVEPGKFNRGMLMNIGYVEAIKRYNYQCAVFHDVDLIPENDKNIYACPKMPRHLSVAIDKFGYRLPYKGIFGGVSVIRREQFEKMNGFPNMFFGWGGEDDDMRRRIARANYTISRYPIDIARYKMMKHVLDSGNERNPLRYHLLEKSYKRNRIDGLNSLVYHVQKVEELPTHLRIQVFIREMEVLQAMRQPL